MLNKRTRILGPIGIVVGAIVLSQLGVSMLQTAPEQAAPAEEVVPVRVIEVEPASGSVTVEAAGVVEPAQELTLVPQVRGQIVELASGMVSGGRFDKGTVLAQIDSTDYRLALMELQNQVAQAKLDLEIEKGRRVVARREWQLMAPSSKEEANADLALREPHLKAASLGVDAAAAAMARAKRDLSRTTLRATFNGVVIEESVEIGQVVGPEAPIAKLVGTDRFWVRVSLPLERLADLEIPGVNAEPDAGSRTRVIQTVDGRSYRRPGRVLRLETKLDTETRTAQVLVGVDDPLEVEAGGVPLLPGAFVTVELQARSPGDVVSIPRRALREGSRVWVAADGRLQVRSVRVRTGDRQRVLISGPLQSGERVVVSALALPIEGMRVDAHPASTAAAAAEPAAARSPTDSRVSTDFHPPLLP